MKNVFDEHWISTLLSKRWNEKKKMIDNFNEQISDLAEDVFSDELLSCIKNLLKDNNIQVNHGAIQTVQLLANRLGKKISYYINEEFIPAIFEKFKEKKEKINKDIINTLLTILKITPLDMIINFLQKMPDDKSGQYKINCCEFLFIALNKTYKSELKKNLNHLIPIFLRLSEENNVEIKNAAFNCLGLLKTRLKDEVDKELNFLEINENKKLRITELSNTITYDTLYDIEPILESPVRSVKSKSRKNDDVNGDKEENSENVSPITVKRKSISLVLEKPVTLKTEDNLSVNFEAKPHNKLEDIKDIQESNNDIEKTISKEAQKALDLEIFERKIEEQMKREMEKSEDKNSISKKPIIKKPIKKEEKEDEDEESGKSNKDEIIQKINAKVGDEIVCLFESTKWEDRKKGFIDLNNWIQKNNNYVFQNFENFIVYIRAQLKNFKEINFNIIREASVLYLYLLSNFKEFGKNYATTIIKGLHEKLGDNKLKDNITSLLISMMEHFTPKYIIIMLLKHLEKNKSVTLLKEYSAFFEKVIEEFGIGTVPVKELVEYSKLLAANTNPQVRSSATNLLCTLYKYIGKDIKTLLKDIKESTLKVIEQELDKIQIVENTNKPKREIKSEEGVQNISSGGDLIPRVDISKKITAKLLKDINDGKWPEKKDAVAAIEKILSDSNMKILPNGLNDLFACFKARLNDGNKNVVRLIVQLLIKLIEALGNNFKQFSKTIAGPLIGNSADKMPLLREDVSVCMDKWVQQVGFETIAIYLPTYLKQDNFEMRTDLLKFLNKNKEQFAKIDLKEFVPVFLNCLQDKSVTIRNAVEEIISYSLKFIPLTNYLNGLKDFKQAIINTIKPILEKYQTFDEIPNDNNLNQESITLKTEKNEIKKTIKVGEKSPSYKKSPRKLTQDNEEDQRKKSPNKTLQEKKSPGRIIIGKKSPLQSEKNVLKKTINSKVRTTSEKSNNSFIQDELSQLSTTSLALKSNSKILSSNTPRLTTSGRKKGLTSSSISTPFNNKTKPSIFLATPNIKIIKEKRLDNDKRFKFNLDTMNNDTIIKLKEVMKNIFSEEFMNKAFSDDMKNVVESINSAIKNFDREDNSDLTIDILDIMFKWIGLKSYNNQNPMIIKVMFEFFEAFLNFAKAQSYEPNETESYIIIGLLLDKVGHTSIKTKEIARALIDKYISDLIIKPSELISIITNRTTSKNPKSKIESIDICSQLITNHGITITNIRDLRNFIKQIITTDNTVKNAFIYLLSELFIQSKDFFHQIVNELPEKIKEHIYSKVNLYEISSENISSTGTLSIKNSNSNTNISKKSESSNLTPTSKKGTSIKFDNDAFPKSSDTKNHSQTLKTNLSDKNLLNVSTTFKHGNVNNNSLNKSVAIQKKGSLSNDNLPVVINNNQKEAYGSNYGNLQNKEDLINILRNLNNGEISEKVNAILIIHELISTKFEDSKTILIPSVNIILKSFIIELRKLFNKKSLEEIPIKYGKYLLTVLYKIASNKSLITNISYEQLLEMSEEVLSSLLIENLDKIGQNQEGVIIIRSLNSTMLRLLENCNYTDVICALLDLVEKYYNMENCIKISGLAIKCLLKINQVI